MNDGLDTLDRCLAAAGVSLIELRARCSEVIVFGSRAAGGGDSRSDWDVLCVGDGVTRRTRALDLVWVSEANTRCEAWVTGELASHVAAHGRWIAGAPGEWVPMVAITPRTIARKARWVQTHVDAWRRFWPRCSPRLRERYAEMLRYNLLRLDCLLAGEAVPPRQSLDRRFAASQGGVDWFAPLATAAGVGGDFVANELMPRVCRV